MTVAGSAPLVVASNRGPISIVPVEDGDDEIRRGGGGLVSGMQSALAATPDDVWMLPIDALTFRQAYNGVANATLWFLLHMLYEAARSPVFDQAWRRSWAG